MQKENEDLQPHFFCLEEGIFYLYDTPDLVVGSGEIGSVKNM